jgi:hypothetical protein
MLENQPVCQPWSGEATTGSRNVRLVVLSARQRGDAGIWRTRLGHLIGCGWFWAWAVVGFGGAFSAVSFALGTLTLLPTLLLAALLWSRASSRDSIAGVLTGAGCLLLLVAWINRGGEPQPGSMVGVWRRPCVRRRGRASASRAAVSALC